MRIKIECMCGCGSWTILDGEFPIILGEPAYYCNRYEVEE